jgi:hypothetical protein
MSEENSEKKEPRVINVVLTEEVKKLMEENTLLKQKITDQEALQTQINLEKFDREKQDMIKAYPKFRNAIESCQTPSVLEAIVESAHLDSLGNTIAQNTGNRQAPSGKAQMSFSGVKTDQYESNVMMIDELYKRAYYNPKEYTKEQVQKAKADIETLLRSTIEGKSWKQLGERGNIQKLQAHSYEACIKCNATIIDSEYPCKNCGYDPSKKSKEGFYPKGPEAARGKGQLPQ